MFNTRQGGIMKGILITQKYSRESAEVVDIRETDKSYLVGSYRFSKKSYTGGDCFGSVKCDGSYNYAYLYKIDSERAKKALESTLIEKNLLLIKSKILSHKHNISAEQTIKILEILGLKNES